MWKIEAQKNISLLIFSTHPCLYFPFSQIEAQKKKKKPKNKNKNPDKNSPSPSSIFIFLFHSSSSSFFFFLFHHVATFICLSQKKTMMSISKDFSSAANSIPLNMVRTTILTVGGKEWRLIQESTLDRTFLIFEKKAELGGYVFFFPGLRKPGWWGVDGMGNGWNGLRGGAVVVVVVGAEIKGWGGGRGKWVGVQVVKDFKLDLRRKRNAIFA